jgi:N-acetylglucosaminyldiphosphoundecaprenol N-acetyl-beta-D-mannosaminyltransferase
MRTVASERPRIRFGSIGIDVVDFRGAIDAVADLVRQKKGGTVFTPNVDHVVLVGEDARLREAYDDVSLSLVDGAALLWSTRLVGKSLPEKISGSDLCVPLLSRAAREGWRVFFLGGAPGSARRAADRMRSELPALKIVGVSAPTIDVERTSRHDALVEEIRAASPDLLFVALGCPKQEIFMHRVRDAIAPTVSVGVGATLDFLAGSVKRAPKWISRAGFEWLYRLSQDPKRLWRRYLVRDPKFLFILARELRS